MLPSPARADQAPGQEEKIKQVSNSVAAAILSAELQKIKSAAVKLMSIDGRDKNIVFGKCSNSLWPALRKSFGAPLKADALCSDFAQTTGYYPENLPGAQVNFLLSKCWVNGRDCGYFTSLGWYFDFKFPQPTFSIKPSSPQVTIDPVKQKIVVTFTMDSLTIQAPQSQVRMRTWYAADKYQDLGPPDYPNSWQSCCQWKPIVPNGPEWNTFEHKMVLNNLPATLALDYTLNLATMKLDLLLSSFKINPVTPSQLSYQLGDIWPQGSLGEQSIEPALQKGAEKLLVSQINKIIATMNKRYGSLTIPLSLKTLKNPVPLNTATQWVDIDFGAVLKKNGRTNAA